MSDGGMRGLRVKLTRNLKTFILKMRVRMSLIRDLRVGKRGQLPAMRGIIQIGKEPYRCRACIGARNSTTPQCA